MNGLTKKQIMFCSEYLIDFNATQAAIRAGYSQKTARQIGYENLKKPHIQDLLAQKCKEISQKADIAIADIVTHLKEMAFFDITTLFYPDGDLLPMDLWPDHAGKVVSSVKVEHNFATGLITTKEIKIPQRERNLENLGRYLAMFTDKTKDVTDPKEYVHIYVPGFRKEDIDAAEDTED